MKLTKGMVQALWGAVILLALIGIAAAVRRILVLSELIPSFDPPQGLALTPVLPDIRS